MNQTGAIQHAQRALFLHLDVETLVAIHIQADWAMLKETAKRALDVSTEIHGYRPTQEALTVARARWNFRQGVAAMPPRTRKVDADAYVADQTTPKVLYPVWGETHIAQMAAEFVAEQTHPLGMRLSTEAERLAFLARDAAETAQALSGQLPDDPELGNTATDTDLD